MLRIGNIDEKKKKDWNRIPRALYITRENTTLRNKKNTLTHSMEHELNRNKTVGTLTFF